MNQIIVSSSILIEFDDGNDKYIFTKEISHDFQYPVILIISHSYNK